MEHYGLGYVAAIPSGVNPTPIPFGLIRDVSLDVSNDMTKERGQYQHVIVVGRGPTDITGKIGSISIFGGAIGQLLGVTPTTGSSMGVPGEIGTIPATPFQVTVANSATFVDNEGVRDLTTGLYMTRVAGTPTTGQYSVAAGVYTFAAADTGHKVAIWYRYTSASVGKTIAVVNSLQTLATGIQLTVYSPPQNGRLCGWRLPSVHFPKLSIALKPADFVVQNLEFFASEDGAAGRSVMEWWTGE